ncbi:hypothetical protein ILUMI_18613 [Ignelater luminosus]|uniref:HTH psq-type domain-containing protein n=1 Tax=Ignelater luminosus TaxID=2038154 RepID=A0A8K0CPS8_IGNLU|nr:hypothetical protein ILUMI_18613 [Ignelater luminosus]
MSHSRPIMARNRKRKSDKETVSKDQMKEAVKLIVEKGKSVRGVAKDTGLSFQTLARYVKKFRNLRDNFGNRQVFTNVQEKELEDFILESSQMCFGLKNNLRMPDAWVSKEIAGKEWTFGFIKRHPRLSLRNLYSLSRATTFNKHNVNTFSDILNTAMMRNPSFGDRSRVFNLGETGLTTVQSPKRRLALPPAMVFPRVHFKEHMLRESPRGTIGLANPSDWMNSNLMSATPEGSSTNKESKKLKENTDFISSKEFIGYKGKAPEREPKLKEKSSFMHPYGYATERGS